MLILNLQLLYKENQVQIKTFQYWFYLSQEELAYRCELDRTYISLLEREKRKPTLNVIFKICENLNIKTSTFVREIEMMMNDN
ncbi:helix-turn-helix domain-containing protein [Clostridium sp. WILCCON 0269]|uniref:Helix-turn-helix domain-containing protein n=1 Tax=Candidatus Clostridium eludens TaxID=3381663 RepID=A0ABW8SS82_9CLOT